MVSKRLAAGRGANRTLPARRDEQAELTQRRGGPCRGKRGLIRKMGGEIGKKTSFAGWKCEMIRNDTKSFSIRSENWRAVKGRPSAAGDGRGLGRGFSVIARGVLLGASGEEEAHAEARRRREEGAGNPKTPKRQNVKTGVGGSIAGPKRPEHSARSNVTSGTGVRAKLGQIPGWNRPRCPPNVGMVIQREGAAPQPEKNLEKVQPSTPILAPFVGRPREPGVSGARAALDVPHESWGRSRPSTLEKGDSP